MFTAVFYAHTKPPCLVRHVSDKRTYTLQTLVQPTLVPFCCITYDVTRSTSFKFESSTDCKHRGYDV